MARDRLNDRTRAPRVLVVLAATAALTGCAERRASLAEIFPPGGAAAPWRREAEVWSGDFSAAAASLGADAAAWQRLGPTRVWLAVYQHETSSAQRLIVRVFAFESSPAAAAAHAALAPPLAKAIEAGDRACWLDDGVLIQWGRIVIEVIGAAAGPAAAEQALYLFALMEKRITPDLAESPR